MAVEQREGGEPARAAAGEGPAAGLAVPALLLVQLCYGLFPAFALTAGGAFDPRAVVVWRIAFAALVFLSLALWRHGRAVLPPAADLPRLCACAVFGILVNQTLALEGMVRSTSTNAGLLMTLIPVFTFGLAILFRQERPTARRAAGIAVAMAGALTLILAQRVAPELGRRYFVGNLLIAGNCLSYSAYLLISRELLRRVPPLVLIAQVICLSLPALPFLAHGRDLTPEAGTAQLWALAYILVFPTVVAYLLNLFALARVPASTTAAFIYLQPLVAGAAGRFAHGERLSPVTLVAAALLFAGIWMVAVVPGRGVRGRAARARAARKGATGSG